MKILLIHQNFPAQFKHLAPELVRRGHDVVALTMRGGEPWSWQGVKVRPYAAGRGSTAGIHPWVSDLETKVIRGEACVRAAVALKQEGFTPDVVLAHPGWGESLFVKEVWPNARLAIYCEFFYHTTGADTGFDPEFPVDPLHNACRLQLKNVNALLHMRQACAGVAPTHWQASTFPEEFRSRITVVHDGIDTVQLAPRADARLGLKTKAGQDLSLTRADEIVTFVNRNLEPYRGYHVFMRGLPDLLRRRPNARVVLVGGDGVSYGAAPPSTKAVDGKASAPRSWRQIFQDEVRDQISPQDWSRVHFVGNLPYPEFISLLQISSVHVYLTYPFVLSWSLMEAMSLGCAIVASDTPPVREMLRHQETGLLVDFFDHAALVEQVCTLLDNPTLRQRLGQAARAHVVAHHDLRSQCLPRQLAWVESLPALPASSALAV